MRFLLAFSFSFLALFPAAAATCPSALKEIPVLSGGRVRPLELHARERIKFITGKSTVEGSTAYDIYCALGLDAISGSPRGESLPIAVNHAETRQFLGLAEDQGALALTDALKKLDSLREYAAILESRGDKTPFAKDLKATLFRVELAKNVAEGRDWTVPVYHDVSREPAWVPLTSWAKVARDQASGSGNVAADLDALTRSYIDAAGDGYLLELTYDRLHLFHWAILVVLAALAVTALSERPGSAAVLVPCAMVLALEGSAVVFRAMISGRAPLANMYETVMGAGIGALLIAMVLAIMKKEKLFLMAGLVFNLCCLFLMTFATDMLDPSIRPLVPVLRDNFWLSTHVTSVTLSYAALALSWLMADYGMTRSLLGSPDPAFMRRIGVLCHDAVKVGVVFLALGILLGGVWADYSWGRFWGWDPKETWSLIALMTYMAVLHGRLAGWVPPKRFVPLVSLAFLSIVMTWFGVNYVLATGLHSYGFSEGGTIFLAVLAVAQIALAGVYAFRFAPES